MNMDGDSHKLIKDILAIYEERLFNMSDDELNEQWWFQANAHHDECGEEDEEDDDENEGD